MNGLTDDQVRFEVKCHTDSANIDEAVSYVVNYMEARKAPHTYELLDSDRKIKRNVKFEDDSSECDESDSDIRDELRLRFKKRKRSVRKVAKIGKRSENTDKVRY